MNISKETQLREIGSPVSAASNTDDNSDRIDMQNWEGARFFTVITDSAATGVGTLTIEENSADSDSGMAALSGATAAGTCVVNDDLNQQLLMVDVYLPKERYLQAVRTSATANIAFGSCFVELYGPRKKPVSQHSTVEASALVVTPADA